MKRFTKTVCAALLALAMAPLNGPPSSIRRCAVTSADGAQGPTPAGRLLATYLVDACSFCLAAYTSAALSSGLRSAVTAAASSGLCTAGRSWPLPQAPRT